MMILKYYEWLKILPEEKHVVYELCNRDPDTEEGVRRVKYLDKDTAMRLIEDNHLIIRQQNKYGIIWE